MERVLRYCGRQLRVAASAPNLRNADRRLSV
jgi:hypothetical protein